MHQQANTLSFVYDEMKNIDELDDYMVDCLQLWDSIH